ncbi:glycerol-3-phosphate acyltransferase [Hydrocarboniclastica marina]|uniref:Glycerol-3-phosphate acyltransferase n=1 Tax=Hydrocarboniclastica marina TaxID=2259620 RepID=A0A4V1D8E5_9ALTE|nr:glycerol-3-phosphate acyltransferase [Hydrocarboniclastica marina]MAL99957.1 acyl-phosphate glycerol 3-phosphate acyltransferase [Alteromonadaceae bacterium]QCF24910.1 glycerol-3-phosphate acyltransferase [Hydrocarboniclastica marina]|tara:strand:- start:951 stop:1547 length:597 start_codon:yes stop_codon:yes gene_type:complete
MNSFGSLLADALPWCLFAYLAGSVLIAPIVCRAHVLPSPWHHGSGNPGATNVYRLGGAWPATQTLFGDAAKATIPIWVAQAVDVSFAVQVLMGLSAVIGHMRPPWHRRGGGKGVATTLGVGIALAPATIFTLGLLWCIIVWRTRTSSIGSITTAILAPLIALWLNPETLGLFVPLSLLMLYRHRDNLARLRQGDENRL